MHMIMPALCVQQFAGSLGTDPEGVGEVDELEYVRGGEINRLQGGGVSSLLAWRTEKQRSHNYVWGAIHRVRVRVPVRLVRSPSPRPYVSFSC